jgi:hypothetical protein
MCPRTPFYREAKGLLHSEIVLETKQYSKCEHVQECLLYPVIYGTNFTYLQACHQFTPRTRTFEATPLTESFLDLRLFIRDSRQPPRSPNQVSAFTAELRFLKTHNSPNLSSSYCLETRNRPAIQCSFDGCFAQTQGVSESCKNNETPS